MRRAQDPADRFKHLEQRVNAQEEQIRQLQSELDKQRVLSRRLPPVAEEGQPASRDRETADASTESRLDRLEQTLTSVQELEQGFLEALSAASPRVVNGRLHVDQWGFPESSPGVNIIETGDPDDPPQDRLLYRRIRFGVRGTVFIMFPLRS
jgi:hypothetical protein